MVAQLLTVLLLNALLLNSFPCNHIAQRVVEALKALISLPVIRHYGEVRRRFDALVPRSEVRSDATTPRLRPGRPQRTGVI